MCALLFVTGCLKSPNAKRSVVKSASTTDNSKTPTKVPDFTTGNNFIQNGSTIYTASVYLDLNFDDYFVLRGKDVDSYIRSSGSQTVSCLTSRFTHAAVSKVIVLAAVPRSVYNYTTQTLEYFYIITPTDSSANQSFCQKTGLVNQLYSLYPTMTPKYKLTELCPTSTNCLATYASEGMQLFSSSGALVNQVPTTNLKFNLSSTKSTTGGSGLSCVENSVCTSQGYDCCSLGQCVKDLALKPGVDTTSTDYAQALQDILNNPSNIYSYPQYYFICSERTTTPTTPTTPTDPIIEAGRRLKRLENLFNCSTKIEGEYGLCTKTYTNAEVGTFYSAGVDDRSFKDTFTHLTVSPDTLVSIEEVSYGEVVLFNYAQKTDAALMPINFDEISATNYVRIEGIHNDDLASGAQIKVKAPVPGTVSKDLVIKYKVDASCSPLNITTAKCEKYYTQGQDNLGDTVERHRKGRVTDHFPDSNVFKLPYYASTTKAITVEVDGIIQREGTDWELVIGSPSKIQFLPINTLKVFKDQKVKISFFSNIAPATLMPSKMAALDEIKTICGCKEVNCSLTPVKNMANAVTDYACVFPEPNLPEPPQTQKVFLSSKTVPVRFFDSNGISQSTVNASSLAQEGGVPFAYRKDNLLNPNNLPDTNSPADTTNSSTNYYIGFNEIYGSLTYANNSAKPAKEVLVKKGLTYDIFVDRGTFSNCLQCGNDYFSNLTRIFPYTDFGGGLVPLQSQTNTISGNSIRSSEFAFGRACFVPATMIPWTHIPESQIKDQRLGRMRAQHFLYANGYQNDWYGFDYGAVIGSFDGVKWFAIGTNRRIKADTNKLFLAVNGQLGDLTIESTYEVTVNDAALNPDGTTMVTTDFNSDGAQCQRYHQCSTDNDCTTTLGWDYACAPVNQITTSWPKFDENGKELPESTNEIRTLTQILNISSPGKRCVYRGRGSLCTANYQNVGASSFTDSKEKVFHACSSNNYCQSVVSGGVATNKFNNRIARYGKVKTDSTVDSFGYGARIPGRPYTYQGLEAVRSETLKNLNGNKSLAVCLPGKDPNQNTFVAQNTTAPTDFRHFGDKVLGIGMTPDGQSMNDNYLMSCSVMDSTKNLYSLVSDGNASKSTNNTLKYDSGTQSLPTNALAAFNTIFTGKSISFGLLKKNSDVLNSVAYTENRCLRAPGASCFTDMDCGPSKTLADKIKALNPEDKTVNAILNKYEIKFWQEELICSQAIAKTSTTYDPRNNRCCRDVGKTMSIGSANLSVAFDSSSAPGIDIDLNDSFRYSRNSTVYKDMMTDAVNFPALQVASKDQCALPAPIGCQPTDKLANQYKTFAALAERTSCSGDWVRSFATGTTKWEAARFQKFDSKTFQCYNWLPGNNNYSCSGIEEDDPACRLVQTLPSSAKAKGIFDYLGRLELTGIPQIALEEMGYYEGSIERDLSCKSYPDSQGTTYPIAGNYKVPPRLFNKLTPPIAEYENTSTLLKYYSAIDTSAYVSSIKTIFKSDEVRGCLPAGTQMNTGENPDLCCTGNINPLTNKCQLMDLVDISVYTNRYVSSEAKKLSPTLFDSNGYVKDPYYVAQLACQKQFCNSGVVGMGALVSLLKTPGRDSENKTFRFLEGAKEESDIGLQQLFNAGLKLNNHAYCLPKSYSGQSNADFTIISCGN
jgi:hypothetical protein